MREFFTLLTAILVWCVVGIMFLVTVLFPLWLTGLCAFLLTPVLRGWGYTWASVPLLWASFLFLTLLFGGVRVSRGKA